MNEHVIDELAAMVSGDLTRSDTEAVAAHLAGCDDCRRHLVANVAAAAALRSAARTAPELFDLMPEPEVRAEAPRPTPVPPQRWAARHPWRVVAAAVVAVVVIAAAVFAGSRLGQPHVTQAEATLHVVGTGSAGGQVVMRSGGTTTNMLVSTTGLPAPGANRFYEVWLFDPTTGKMLAVGVLGPQGKGAYALSPALLSQYQVVDISRQANNGNPQHSHQSVLRATYAA